MELTFQLIDCDYISLDNAPVIRMFGKTKEGRTVCAFHKGFLPYFYVLPKDKKEQDIIKFLQDKFKHVLIKIEEDEKKLPIGFQTEKTKLLKITLNDPSIVPQVRDELREQKSVVEVYEADILFKYRFMADRSLSGMKWVRVSGENANTSTVKTEKTIAATTIQPVENDANISLKTMGLDIEVAPAEERIPDSAKDKIVMLSMSFFPAYNGHNTLVLVSKTVQKTDSDVLAFDGEKKLLEEFAKIMDVFDPDVVCGYNLNNFDLPFILDRLRINKISRAIGRCRQKQAMSRKVGARFRGNVQGRVIVDVFDLIKESVGKGLIRLKRYSLGDVSKELLNEDKVDITHGEIVKHWQGDQKQVQKLIEYSRKDAELVLKLLLEKDMISKFIEVSKVSGLLLQDVLDSGESARAENLMLREFDKRGYVIPCKPSAKEIQKRIDEREAKGLKGALVLNPEIGLHTNSIIYLDFRSMYPSIFISWNICPTTLLLGEQNVETINTPYGAKFVSPKVAEGISPKIVSWLIKERDKIKDQMRKKPDDKVLNAKQYALKIMANAFYGYTGYIRARFYTLDIANAITSCGRELIQATQRIVESDNQFKVVYGDTDSVMVKVQTADLDEAFKKGKEVEEKINRELGGKVSIKIENVFKSLLILTKKRYAGLSFEKTDGDWREKMIMKGIETVRRDWCDLVGETLYQVLEIILKEQEPKKAFEYVKGILSKIEKNDVPIEKLVITKGISKPLGQYKGVQPHIELAKKLRKRSPASAPSIGDRVGFVIVKGLQLMSDRAEDLDYVKNHGLKIDSKYYIESQLLPPLERVFEAIGISKSELIGIGKQMLLLDAMNHKPQITVLNEIDGFVCNRCDKTFRRVPLVGKCSCGGEILFYLGDKKSRQLNI
jgi:DNA polymerase I